jgi:hypothetical protein
VDTQQLDVQYNAFLQSQGLDQCHPRWGVGRIATHAYPASWNNVFFLFGSRPKIMMNAEAQIIPPL